MRTKLLSTLIIIIALATGCSEEPQTARDYIIFGDFYGMCAGNSCVDYYKIEDGQLFKDQLNEYPDGSIHHQFESYTSPYNNSIMDLSGELPSNIYSEGDLIGSPDAYDQGGLYIEIRDNGNVQNWKIDKDDANVPAYLHTLCDSVEHYLSVLN